jgi:hypothetical protein
MHFLPQRFTKSAHPCCCFVEVSLEFVVNRAFAIVLRMLQCLELRNLLADRGRSVARYRYRGRGWLACVLGMAFCAAVGTVNAGPKIVCSSPSYEFKVSQGMAAVEHTFVLENHGDETLVFRRVHGCCGATLSLRDKTVAPGTNTTLHLKLALEGRRGAMNKSVYVSSNDPKRPFFPLKIKGTIGDRAAAVPRLVHFGAVAPASTTTQVVDVGVTAGGSITNVQCTSACFEASVVQSRSNRYAVTVGLVPPLPDGLIQGRVRLLTDSARAPVIEFPVQVIVVSDIIVVPRELTLIDAGSATKPVSVCLALRSRKRAPFRITDVQFPGKSVAHELTALGSAGWSLKMLDVLPRAEFDGTDIVIKLDRENEQTVSVPIRVVKRP